MGRGQEVSGSWEKERKLDRLHAVRTSQAEVLQSPILGIDSSKDLP